MRELIGEKKEIVELAERALRREGIGSLLTAPVRGCTPGSQLTFRGLFCPNIGTGDNILPYVPTVSNCYCPEHNRRESEITKRKFKKSHTYKER
ncbi:MAG: hypothetical protein V8S72_01095 [Oscillospiraceae bacterium]